MKDRLVSFVRRFLSMFSARRVTKVLNRIFWKRAPVAEWIPVDPAEISRFRWPNGNRSDLRVYSLTHEQRKPAEAFFAAQVRRSIRDARAGQKINCWLLVDSLKGLTDKRFENGFESWLWITNAILGGDTCRSIGMTVCKMENFTLEEAEKLFVLAV